MRTRCLVIDNDTATSERVIDTVKDIPSLDVQSVVSLNQSAAAIHSFRPNIIFFRCGDSAEKDNKMFKMIGRLQWKCEFIPILSQPQPNLIQVLFKQLHVADILTDDADQGRIKAALNKAYSSFCSSTKIKSYYKGFICFVGTIPSLRERKILSDACIGLIQNRSLRLAIDYWRKNADSQMVCVAFNTFETFTTRPEEMIECWDDFDIMPWEYGLYEAQQHYLEYWLKAIKDNLLPPVVSTLLREGDGDLCPLSHEDAERIIIKVDKAVRHGTMEEILRTMGVAFRDDSKAPPTKKYSEFIQKMDEHLQEVDQVHPELTRPPSETGYEDFTPDVATQRNDDYKRMAFHQRKK